MKKVTPHVDLSLSKQNYIYFVSPKRRIRFWWPKSISLYKNFLNWSTEREKKKKEREREREREKPRSRLLFIFHKPQQVLEEDEKQSMTGKLY